MGRLAVMRSALREAADRTVVIGCAAPPEAAWALLADPRRWPGWAGPVRRVTIARGHDARPPLLADGQLLVVHGPRPVTLRTRIDRVDRGRRCEWTVDLGGPWRLRGLHAVEPRPGGCRLIARQRLDGPLARVGGPALLGAATSWTRRALHRLAWMAERDPRLRT